MAKYKTKFELENLGSITGKGKICIIGNEPENKPYVKIEVDIYGVPDFCIKDKDLEKFAVNILRAINSKHLKTN